MCFIATAMDDEDGGWIVFDVSDINTPLVGWDTATAGVLLRLRRDVVRDVS